MFGKPAFASLSQRNALRKHQCDLRQFYSERIFVNAIELPGAKQRCGSNSFLRAIAEILVNFCEYLHLDVYEFPIGDIEKVATTTCRVEYSKRSSASAKSRNSLSVDACAMRSRHGRTIVGRTAF